MSRYSNVKGIVTGLNTAIGLARIFDCMDDPIEAITLYRELLANTLAPFEADLIELRNYYKEYKDGLLVLSDSAPTDYEEEQSADSPDSRQTGSDPVEPVQEIRERSTALPQGSGDAD